MCFLFFLQKEEKTRIHFVTSIEYIYYNNVGICTRAFGWYSKLTLFFFFFFYSSFLQPSLSYSFGTATYYYHIRLLLSLNKFLPF